MVFLDAAGATAADTRPRKRRMERQVKRPPINITPVERAARVAVGVVGIIAGTLLLAQAGGTVAVLLEVLLVLAGLDLVMTGAVGHCPLYKRLGYVPRSLRRPA